MQVSRPRVAVVGHVEWVQFARVPHVPRAGEVVHACDPFEEPAGGGAVAAVQLARLAGEAVLLTALGEDEHGRRSVGRLQELGVQVWAAQRATCTRRAVTLVDDAGERTITTLGPRLEPVGDDEELPWSALEGMDAVYFTAGDLGALRAARAARVLVASPRTGDALGHGIPLDALVLSGDDAIERHGAARAQAEAELVVFTEGERGGAYRERSGASGRWEPARLPALPAAVPPAAPVDSYGCGDSFAAGLTYGLGAGMTVPDALTLASRCGAVCLTGRGPYERQLTGSELIDAVASPPTTRRPPPGSSARRSPSTGRRS
jgi:ribokinase